MEGQAGACAAAQGQSDRFPYLAQQHCAAAVAEGQSGYLLSEGFLHAGREVTEEPPDAQVKHAVLATDCGVGDPAFIATVHPQGETLTTGAGRGGLSAMGVKAERTARQFHPIDVQSSEVREEHGKQLKGGHSAGSGPSMIDISVFTELAPEPQPAVR
jgi:hypothetical protein